MIAALCMSLITSVLSYPVCKSDTGATVDSWFQVKGPKGTESLYYDGTTGGFVQPTHDLNSTKSGALAATLGQLWSESTTDYIIFNDEPAGSSSYNFSVGHTKGIWAWNVEQDAAIVLQHSVPLFPVGPSSSGTYRGLGGNAWMYGQHLACFSFSVGTLAELAQQTILTVPDIYDSRVSDSAPPALQALAQGAFSTDPICNLTVAQTTGGQIVTYYAKSSQWNDELYASCIAPSTDESLLVESWIRGSAEGPSCGSLEVLDVQNLSYPFGLRFTEYNDHSKWAIGRDLVCASDINRMTTQYTRGGSAFCFHDTVLAEALRAAVVSADSC
jgi:hypothetical protein